MTRAFRSGLTLLKCPWPYFTESYVARLKDLKGQMDSAFPLRDTLRAEVATVRLGYTVPPASQALLKRYESSQYVDRGSFEGLIVTR